MSDSSVRSSQKTREDELISSESAAGPEGAALNPPAYGIDAVDSGMISGESQITDLERRVSQQVDLEQQDANSQRDVSVWNASDDEGLTIIVDHLDGNHVDVAQTTPVQVNSSGSISTAGDVARLWEKQKQETERILNDWVQENPSLAKNLAATSLQTAMDLGEGLVDILKLGEGAAEGGWGLGKDALRLLALAGPMVRVARALKPGLVVGLSTETFAVSQAKLLKALRTVSRGEASLVSHGNVGIIERAGQIVPLAKIADIIRKLDPRRVRIIACKLGGDLKSVQRLANLTDVPITVFRESVHINQLGQVVNKAGKLAQPLKIDPQPWSSFFSLSNKGSTLTGLAAGEDAAEKKKDL